ncbi:hypothetical protein BJY00DRAFT_292942 [Aspergillus carlsbadensis]|nr:hypothetical protein BJY00DRAFT_292942 [Aspergillus carlsbadensis]
MKFARSALRLASCRPAFRPQTSHARLRPVVLQRFQSSIPPHQTPWILDLPVPKPSDAAVGVFTESKAPEDSFDVSETADVAVGTPTVDSEAAVEVHDFDEEYSGSIDLIGLDEDEVDLPRPSEDSPDASLDAAALDGRVLSFMNRFHLQLDSPDLLVKALRCTGLRTTAEARSLAMVGYTVFRLYATVFGQANGFSPGKVTAMLKVMYSNKALARHAWKIRLDETTDLRSVMATATDFRKETLDRLLANVMEAVVGAVYISKKHNLDDTIAFLKALGLDFSEKTVPQFLSKDVAPGS